MTSSNVDAQKRDRPDIQPRRIQREHVRQSLAIAAMLALLTASCDSSNNQSYAPITPSSSAASSNASDEQVRAVFYKTLEDCEADVQTQQSEYDVLEAAFQRGELAESPTQPVLEVEDCEPQMAAAQAEHLKHAPTYASLEDCEADGLKCEPTQNTESNSSRYYSPRFGGGFFYPYGGPSYTYINYGGAQRQVYQPRTVYEGLVPGQVVTPNGQALVQNGTGQVNAPVYTQTAAPARPKGTAARGTVGGRGSKGFGATFKGTGRGGK